MNKRHMIGGALAWGLGGLLEGGHGPKPSPKRLDKIRKRSDWRSGPTPARGSRRWKVMMNYRKAVEGVA